MRRRQTKKLCTIPGGGQICKGSERASRVSKTLFPSCFVSANLNHITPALKKAIKAMQSEAHSKVEQAVWMGLGFSALRNTEQVGRRYQRQTDKSWPIKVR